MRLLLTITSGSLNGQTFDLSEGALSIGRSENSSIRFDPLTEKIASKQHAFIELRPDGFYLIDNRSTNGTFLNERRIDSAKLNDGDIIQFGKHGNTAKVAVESGFVSQPTVQSAPANQGQFAPPTQFPPNVQNQPASLRDSMANFGLGHYETPQVAPKSQTGKYIGIAITIFGVVFLSLIVMLILFASVGIGTAILAAIVAFIPAMIYIQPLIFLDRYDPEPLWLLALAFAWGALVSVIISIIFNEAIGFGVATIIHPAIGNLAAAIISAPIFEESSKGIGLLILLLFFRRYFDDILDGIVFAGVIALGFATVENVLYYGNGINKGGFEELALIFGLRGILSPFAHVVFTSMTGIGCGIARESHNKAVRFIMPVVGYIAAVVLHMIWNAMGVVLMLIFSSLDLLGYCSLIGLEKEPGLCSFLVGYGILEVPLFAVFLIFLVYIMRRQNKILKDMLAIDVARGIIPEEHLNIATSAFKSSGWLLGSLFSGKFRARKNYMRAIGKLGLSYWHIQRATAAQGHTASFQQNPILRDEVIKWRDQV
jgi:protease PrsW